MTLAVWCGLYVVIIWFDGLSDLCGFVVSMWFCVLSIRCHVVHVWPHVVLSGLYVVSCGFYMVCVVSEWFHLLSMRFHVVLVWLHVVVCGLYVGSCGFHVVARGFYVVP